MYGGTTHQTGDVQDSLSLCLVSQIGQTPLAREDATFVEQELGRIGEANAWTIGALNVQEDHVHLFLSAPPAIASAQIASTLRATTRRLVFQRFLK